MLIRKLEVKKVYYVYNLNLFYYYLRYYLEVTKL